MNAHITTNSFIYAQTLEIQLNIEILSNQQPVLSYMVVNWTLKHMRNDSARLPLAKIVVFLGVSLISHAVTHLI